MKNKIKIYSFVLTEHVLLNKDSAIIFEDYIFQDKSCNKNSKLFRHVYLSSMSKILEDILKKTGECVYKGVTETLG